MHQPIDLITTLRQYSDAVSSSYAETDWAHSDSDSDDGRSRADARRKCSTSTKRPPHVWARTAPISIPCSRRAQPHRRHQCESVSASPTRSYHADMRRLRASRYVIDGDDLELDEDDPVFYGNLAFFRSQQHGASLPIQNRCETSARAHYSLKVDVAAPVSPTGVDVRDGAIFAMEL
ncbi:unnamed protein product [Hyaloperonospora brassicae]|uniref:Uncharacterized protein n=1 Tax=Hyaloperonospora brassicae TaxID=162125 RepID=A0AAV0TBF0_HYABA|nr:unnamed protein product [Hyaloperonospora brassicae]